MLGVLRAERPPRRRRPRSAAAAADLAALVEASRAAGVRVELAMDVAELPDTLARTVYRVVQEALTNVHKHARGAATVVRSLATIARTCPGRVTNRRAGGGRHPAAGSGAGLIGLRERVALVGGTLTAGPTADGGWQVDAVVAHGRHRAAVPHGDGSGARRGSHPDRRRRRAGPGRAAR